MDRPDTHPHKCPYCSRRMKSKTHMRDHIRIHTGEKPYKCHRCSYASNQAVNLRIHLQKYNNLPMQCEHCPLKFCSYIGLQNHERDDHHHNIHNISSPPQQKLSTQPENPPPNLINSVPKPNSLSKDSVQESEPPELYPEDSLQENSPEIRIDSVYSMEQLEDGKSKKIPEKKQLFQKKISSVTKNSFKCPYCGKGHNSRSHMEEHMRVHTGERPFLCNFCSYKSITASSLRTHNKSSDGAVLKCSDCNFTSCTLMYLKIHQKKEGHGEFEARVPVEDPIPLSPMLQPIVYVEDILKTGKINGMRMRPKVLQKSNQEEKPEEKETEEMLSCKKCSYTTRNPLNMRVHLRHRKNNKPVLRCPDCSYTACFPIGMHRHRKGMHPESKAQVTFKKRAQVKPRMQVEEEEEMEEKEEEEEIHEDIENLPTYGCAYCGFFSLDKNEVKGHLWIHNGEKPFICMFCDRRFTTRINAEVHERVHTGVQPYQCSHCGKTFSQKCNLHTHLRSRHGVQVEGRKIKKNKIGLSARRNTIDAAARVSRKYRA